MEGWVGGGLIDEIQIIGRWVASVSYGFLLR